MEKKCEFCSQETSEDKNLIIMTAKSKIKYKFGRGYHYNYMDFQPHVFGICSNCKGRRTKNIFINSILFIVSIFMSMSIDIDSFLYIPVTLVLFYSIYTLYYGRIILKLKKVAIKERKNIDDGRIKALSMAEFLKLESAK